MCAAPAGAAAPTRKLPTDYCAACHWPLVCSNAECQTAAARAPARAGTTTRESEQNVGKSRGDSGEPWGNDSGNPTTRDPDKLIAFIRREREGYADTIARLRAEVSRLSARTGPRND